MTRKEFYDKILIPRLDSIQLSLEIKANEYAQNNRAFHNFEKTASINGVRPEEALWGMASKHLVSIIDMVYSNKSFDDKYIDEKIGDMINYLILLEGMMKNKPPF